MKWLIKKLHNSIQYEIRWKEHTNNSLDYYKSYAATEELVDYLVGRYKPYRHKEKYYTPHLNLYIKGLTKTIKMNTKQKLIDDFVSSEDIK